VRNRTDIIFEDSAVVLESVDFAPMDGATVFITGATGLLGTHFLASLCLLKEKGAKINVLAEHHSTPADYTVEIARRGGFLLRNEIPKGADMVIHAAGYAQPSVFTLNPAETIRLNTTVTQELLKNLWTGGRLLFISSSGVYNGLTKARAAETDIGTTTPYHPRACYIEGKRCGEAICHAYYKAGVHAVSARLARTYGPGTRKNDRRAIGTFIDQALTAGRIDLEFSGHSLGTYCYVRDAMKMLWNVALHGTEPVYNVGGKATSSVLEVAEHVGSIIGVEVTSPKSLADMLGSDNVESLDMSRIESEFGEADYMPLCEGLRRTIEWQRGLYASVQG
jgi:UDP-glucuronate decarboxylase